MIRNLRALGLGLVAALSLSAVAASASSAAQLHSEAGHTILTGSQPMAPNELGLDVGVMKCGVAKFDGTIAAATTTTFSLTPTFGNCEIGGVEVLFTHNECKFRFHIGPNEHPTGTVDIVCPDQPIEIDGPACVVTIPPQAGLQGETFTNEGEGAERRVIVDLNLGGIHYVEHGMGCQNQTVTTNNGTYTGQITLTGESAGGAHRGIWVQ
jgi:hypothetical protein